MIAPRPAARRRPPLRRGFTLVEILVAAALLFFLIGSTMNVLIATNNATERVLRVGNTQEAAREALDAFAADLRLAGLGVALGQIGIAPAAASTRRFVIDPDATDDPSRFAMISRIGPCETQVMAQLREIRVQLVAISTTPDKASDLGQLQIGYRTPAFEGAGPTPVAGKPAGDPYPRRAFVTRVVPRNLQGIRL